MQTKMPKGLMFFGGVIAGAVATYFIQSPQGKEIRSRITEKGKEIGENLKSKADDLSIKANEKINSLADSVKAQTDSALETMDETADNFKEGISKARSAIKNHNSIA